MAQMETGEAPTREVGDKAEVETGSLNIHLKYAQRLVTQQCNASIGLTKPTQGSNHSIEEEEKYAFLASQGTNQEYDRYFDNGASNHVTHQTEKVQEINEHHGKTSLIIIIGEQPEIIATSSSKLKSLNLHDILYMPNITKNLLSVSKLAADNNILVEFDKNCCFMKDKLTGKAVLKGKLKDG